VKFLHLADFHLDSALGALPPEKAAIRRREMRETVSDAFILAQEENADMIFISGDLFDGDNTFFDTVRFLMDTMGKVPAHIFISPGNHDFISPSSPYFSCPVPKNVTIFKRNAIERAGVFGNVAVYGAAFCARWQDAPLIKGFSRDSADKTSVLVMHADDVSPSSRYNPVSPEDMERSAFTYAALGHNHEFSGKLSAGSSVYAHPGCIEGRGFDETGAKGAIVGEISEGCVDIAFRPLCRRRYEVKELDISDVETADGLFDRLRALSSERDILRIVLSGERGVDIDVTALQSALSENFFHLSLIDRSRRREDIFSRAGEQSLRGLFLKELKRKLDRASSDEERSKILLAARYGLCAMDGENAPDRI